MIMTRLPLLLGPKDLDLMSNTIRGILILVRVLYIYIYIYIPKCPSLIIPCMTGASNGCRLRR